MEKPEILIPDFRRFRKNPYRGLLITLDPGETTGWSKWIDGVLLASGQLETSDIRNSVKPIQKWIGQQTGRDELDVGDYHLYPVQFIMEEYRIYGWKTESHAWSTVHTIKLIGLFETLLTQWGISYQFQGAGLAKTFADDDKLTSWGFWKRGEKHARDALRHAIYFYCSKPKDPQIQK